MAEAIGIVSGIAALITFGLQSSQLLYETIDGFKHSTSKVRGLLQQIRGLQDVLNTLDEIVQTGVSFSALEKPLLECGKACRDFEALIKKLPIESSAAKRVEGLAKLKFMGSDINGFKELLESYKSTITIALGVIALRDTTFTKNALVEYQELVANTTVDLEDILQRIEGRVNDLALQGNRNSSDVAGDRRRIQEEKESTEQCLAICAEVSNILRLHQERAITLAGRGAVSTTASASSEPGHSSSQITSRALEACGGRLATTTIQLEDILTEMHNKLSKSALQRLDLSQDDGSEEMRLAEERASIIKRLEICSDASHRAREAQTNNVEDVEVAEDGQQVIISTVGHLINARRITAGARSSQYIGQANDSTFQQLSRDHVERLANRRDGSSIGSGSDTK